MSTLIQQFPFRRLFVTHIVEGGSQVIWDLDPSFAESRPYTFQLQAGHTGLSIAVDWVDVGGPVVDGFLAVDDQKRLFGKTAETHYRVVLRTPVSTYVSLPVDTSGSLGEKDWVTAREIVRKELLRHSKVSYDGVLLKRLRYGPRCTRCLDPQTGELTNSRCPECYGTGFSGGYHAPLHFQWFDEIEESPQQEKRGGDGPPGQSKNVQAKVRAMAAPYIYKEDVIINTDSDIRWIVESTHEKASMRQVPLILEVTMNQAPFTDVIYRFQAVPGQAENTRTTLPTAGTGSVNVDHDYGGTDLLAYQAYGCCGIEGATILAFTKEAWDNGARTASLAVATTTTTGAGRWAWAMCLDPGDYILLAEKVGEFGPDTIELTVEEPAEVDTPAFVPPAPPSEPPSLMAITPKLSATTDFGIF